MVVPKNRENELSLLSRKSHTEVAKTYEAIFCSLSRRTDFERSKLLKLILSVAFLIMILKQL